MPSKDYNEKRDFIRMRVDTPANIAMVKGEENYTGVCQDLSGGGLLVKLDQKIPKGTELEVKIASEHGHSPMLSARATVTRCEAEKDADGLYELGLRIDELLT